MSQPQHVLDLLKEVGALKEGHFRLASGRHSANYVQTALLTQYPAKLQPLLDEARPKIDALGPIDTVFFPAIGALPVGQQVAYTLGKRGIFTERDADNVMQLRRGFELHKGENILLVEDVVTTGGTLKEIRPMAEALDVNIVGVFCVINRSGKSDWEGLPLVSVIDLTFPTYADDEVPEALAAIPVYRPGTKKV